MNSDWLNELKLIENIGSHPEAEGVVYCKKSSRMNGAEKKKKKKKGNMSLSCFHHNSVGKAF